MFIGTLLLSSKRNHHGNAAQQIFISGTRKAVRPLDECDKGGSGRERTKLNYFGSFKTTKARSILHCKHQHMWCKISSRPAPVATWSIEETHRRSVLHGELRWMKVAHRSQAALCSGMASLTSATGLWWKEVHNCDRTQGSGRDSDHSERYHEDRLKSYRSIYIYIQSKASLWL